MYYFFYTDIYVLSDVEKNLGDSGSNFAVKIPAENMSTKNIMTEIKIGREKKKNVQLKNLMNTGAIN